MQNFADVTYADILHVFDSSITKNLSANYRYEKGRCGFVLDTLEVPNTIQNRNLCHLVTSILQKAELEDEQDISSYSCTPPSPLENVPSVDIHNAFDLLTEKLYDLDVGKKDSLFGHVSIHFGGTNSRKERDFLQSFYLKHIQARLIDSTLAKTVAAIQLQTEKNELNDHRKLNSIFGHAAATLCLANTFKVRCLLNQIWNTFKEISTENEHPLPLKNPILNLNKERRRKITRAIPENNKASSENKRARINFKSPVVSNYDLQHGIKEFKISIHSYAEHPCQICKRLQYKNKLRKLTFDSTVCSLIEDLFPESSILMNHLLSVCNRCKITFNRKAIPAQAFFNKMTIESTPVEVKNLSRAEIQLVSQVRPFMKIYHLCRGRGQQAIKGTVVHFPNSIEEFCEKLPLTSREADLIIVKESLEDLPSKELLVRPDKIQTALQWLKSNNPLYLNVQINERSESELQPSVILPSCPTSTQTIEELQSQNHSSYKAIGNDRQILRGSFHQSAIEYCNSANLGMQCTAMAAVCISYAYVQSPATWTTTVLDQVLFRGDRYFTEKCDGIRRYLLANEIQGEIEDVFGSVNLTISIVDDAFALNGQLNKLADYLETIPSFENEIKRLHQSLFDFITSDYSFGIITVADYSMALITDNQNLYYFDSHSRGPKGGLARDGLACIIQFPIQDAPRLLSNTIHRNIQPEKFIPSEDVRNTIPYLFSIVPVLINNDSNILIRNIVELPSTSSKEFGDDQSGKNAFGEHMLTDCMFHAVDYNVPELQNVISSSKTIPLLCINKQKGRPLFPSKEERLEELSFVNLFPYGKGGLSEERKIKISTLDYFQQRIMSDDCRFWENSYLFYALARMEEVKVKQKINVCAMMKSGPRGNDEINEEHDYAGLSNIHLYMSSIRGSTSYWKKYTGDLISMIKQIGIPTLFLTVSSDDLNSTDSLAGLLITESQRFDVESEQIRKIRNLIQESNFDKLEDLLKEVPYDRKVDLLNNHPVQAARHFSNRIKGFIKLISKNAKEIFGFPLKDYSYRIEFQYRGSGHVHMLIWLEDVPTDFETLEGKQFIENNISCSIPDNDDDLKKLVLKYQNHKHTKTCFKNGKGYCRFDFPRKMSSDLHILDEDEIHQNHGRFLILKRKEDETMVNNYHPKLLKICKCNMDIQLVTGATGIAYYIAKYISKAEPTDLREEIQKIMTDMQSNTKAAYHQKALKIAMKIMNHREVGAPEAAFRLCHLELRRSSLATVFVPACRPEKRIHLIHKETVGQKNTKLGLNIIEKYCLRPVALQHLCLYEFAAFYESTKHPSSQEEADPDKSSDEDAEVYENTIRLQNGKGTMKKRKRPAIVKYPNFDVIREKDDYYYCLIVLYLPFTEENFINQYSSIEDAFRNLHNCFRNSEDSEIVRPDLAQQIDKALIRMAAFGVHDSELEDREEEPELFFEDDEDINEDDLFQEQAQPVNLIEFLEQRYRSLSSEQKEVYQFVENKLHNPDTDQVLSYISGAGGVGKSYLIEVLSARIDSMKRFEGTKNLLRAAPTGLSALNINATTCHRAFCLPVQKKGSGVGNYLKLGGKKLQEMRNLFQYVDWIIIDEISMVSYEMLRMIHLRLCEIKNSEMLFGGINILTFGDLMQLRPVKGNWVFNQPKTYCHEPHLWRKFTFFELLKNHRQTGDDRYLNLLNRLREGHSSIEDMELLESRIFDPEDDSDRQLIAKFQDALALFPTNSEVDAFNSKKLDELRLKNPELYIIRSQDTYGEGLNYGNVCPPTMISTDCKETAGIPSSIELGVDARVMLRRNLSLPDKLVNGSVGTVVGIKWTALRVGQLIEGDLPESIIIKFDAEMGGKRKDFNGFVHLEPVSVEIIGKRNTVIRRRMFPLVHCWALNFHKCQGTTLNMASISLGKKVFAKGMAYVALSRVKSLDGLNLIEIERFKLLTTCENAPCCNHALREMYRLRISRNIGTMDNNTDVDKLLDWMLGYPRCSKCKKWTCNCICK